MLRHLLGATNLRRGSEEKKGYKTSSNRWVALNARQVQVLRAWSSFLPKSSTSVCPACSSPRFKKRGSEAAPWLIDVRLGLKATEHPGSGNSHALDPRPPAFPFSQFLGFVDPAPEEEPPPCTRQDWCLLASADRTLPAIKASLIPGRWCPRSWLERGPGGSSFP